MSLIRQFAGYASRTQQRVDNNLGIINKTGNITKVMRRKDLDILDAYYESRQYDGMPAWEDTADAHGDYVKVRARQPKLNFNFAKVLTSRVTSKLVGKRTFPEWTIEDDPITTEFFRFIRQSAMLRANIIEPVRRCLCSGSVFVRFAIVGGQWKMEHYLGKWCFPTMDSLGNLQEMRIQYVYDDMEDLDATGQPKRKWYKMEMGPLADILYDNPDYKEDTEPEFTVVGRADHELGFVQGEWMITADEKDQLDGPSLVADALPFIDEINYVLSQSSEAVAYNQDPQLTLKNMDEDEIDALIRSSRKAWNLGREGEANLLEAGMNGVQSAIEFKDKIGVGIQDLTRIVMLDPEKAVSHAQSGRAMEVLHGPLVELVEELRPQFEKHLKNLQLKMGLAVLIQNERKAIVPIQIPEGFKPSSLELIAKWPEVFPMTLEDLQKKSNLGITLSNANIISRETVLEFIAKDFGIEDIEEEKAKIAAQPILNPFGSF